MYLLEGRNNPLSFVDGARVESHFLKWFKWKIQFACDSLYPYHNLYAHIKVVANAIRRRKVKVVNAHLGF